MSKRHVSTVLLLGLLVLASQSRAESTLGTNVRALVNVVQACVDRHDTSYPVFHGCVDWHSAVHGYWALLWGAHMLDDKPLADAVLQRFDRSSLGRELRLMRSDDQAHSMRFEMPYGRAWFLQLARDAEQLYGFRELRPLADYIYRTLLDYARRGGGEVTATDYQNASWYLYQLYKWADFNGYQQDQRMLRGLIVRRYASQETWPVLDDNQGFFDPREMAALLLSSVDEPVPDWRQLMQAVDKESLRTLDPPFVPVHRAGLNYSRSWGLIALAKVTKDVRYKMAVEQNRKVMMDSMNYWAHDYRHFGHWVAQFGLFSYRLEFTGEATEEGSE